MKPLTVFNFLMLPVVVALVCWFILDRIERQWESSQVLGYSFELLDADTRTPVRSPATVTFAKEGHGFCGVATYSKETTRLSGWWIGHLPDTISITAPNYEQKTLPAGLYTTRFEDVYLKQTGKSNRNP